MGVSSTRVGDHRGSARTVQYLSKNHMMVSGLRSARSGALPHLAVFAAESPVLCLPSLSSLRSPLSRLSIISLSLSRLDLDLVSCVLFSLGTSCLSMSVPNSYPGRPRVWPGAGARGPGGMSRITSGSRLARLRLIWPRPPVPRRAGQVQVTSSKTVTH